MRMRSIAMGMAVGLMLPAMAQAFTGIFRTAYTEVAASNPTGIAVGDFDLDPDHTLDVVTSNAGVGGNELNGLIGFNDGTISAAGPMVDLNSFPSGLLKGTFDDDSIPDLIVAKSNEDEVQFLKGLGNDEFFAPPGPGIGVGHAPIGLATADLDGDGLADLVVANEGADSSPGSITILRGQGNGQFTLVQQEDPSDPEKNVDSLPAELGTVAAAIGNIDTEPGLDIVAVNSRSNTLSIFTSDGHMVLTPRGSIPVGAGPQDVALVDLNDDGKLDLVIANANDDAVTVQLGNGDRTFQPAQSYAVGTAPTHLAIGDLDGDAELDLAVINSRSGDVSVLIGGGDGMFRSARTFVADAEPQALALGDFNNDGLLDPVTATQGSDNGPTVAVLRNLGGGALQAIEDLRAGSSPAAVAVADVDDDGAADLLVGTNAGQLLIFPGTPSGVTAPREIQIGGRVLGVAAADLDGDARPDIVLSDAVNARVAILKSLGGGTFAAPVFASTSPNPGAVTIGDYDDDGRRDIAVSTVGSDRSCQGGSEPGKSCTQDAECSPGICSAPGTAAVLLQQANGSFGPFRDTAVEETPTGIATLDLNCDGKDDLVVANLASNTVSLLARNAANDGFTIVQTLPGTQVGQSPIALAVADFDQDGVADLAVTNTVAPGSTANVHLFKGSCTAPFLAPFGAIGSQVHVGSLASALVARDFTGDQIVDLAVLSQTDNNVQLLRGVGDGTVRPSGSDTVSRMPIAVSAGDFDSDGRYDAVTANSDPSANNVSVLSNCARDVGCDPFGRPGPPGSAALRGDANDDSVRSAGDLVAIAMEVMDGDGTRVEDIARGSIAAAPGADANGDGRVDAQDRTAAAHRIFGG